MAVYFKVLPYYKWQLIMPTVPCILASHIGTLLPKWSSCQTSSFKQISKFPDYSTFQCDGPCEEGKSCAFPVTLPIALEEIHKKWKW